MSTVLIFISILYSTFLYLKIEDVRFLNIDNSYYSEIFSVDPLSKNLLWILFIFSVIFYLYYFFYIKKNINTSYEFPI